MSGRGATGLGSPARASIAEAALALGLADPLELADELGAVDVDALHEWFGIAAQVQVWLGQGGGRLADGVDMLAAGWSAPAPQRAIRRWREAGLISRQVVAGQVDAANRAEATLRQSRSSADAALSACESSIVAIGWPPGESLIFWAATHDQLAPLRAILTDAAGRLGELQARNDQALHDLALALRADPRDPVQQIPALGSASGGTLAQIGAPAAGPRSEPGAGWSAGPPAPSEGSGVDKDNLTRLAADLQSSDPATAEMARGVNTALEKASSAGGVAQLLVYESAGGGSQGRAAVSVGDITTADNITTFAPGISNAPVNMTDGISNAVALRREAERLAPGDTSAVVAWYGYDIPLSAIRGVSVPPWDGLSNAVAAVHDDHARAGGSLLVDDIARFHDWAQPTARFTAVGFSMGSTTVSAAAARGAEIDDLVLLASPGASMDVTSARDYPNLPAQHTFAVSFDQDPVTAGVTDLLAGFAGSVGRLPFVPGALAAGAPLPYGPDPASQDFGAQVIDVPSNAPLVSVDLHAGLGIGDLLGSAIANRVAAVATQHQESNYLSGASLTAIAHVVDGQYADVPTKPGR